MEPVRTGFSTYIFEGDGVTNVFPLQFTLGELKRSYVTCQVADEVDGLGNPVYRELIEVPGDPSMIQIGGTVPAVGAKIEFKRVVPKDLLLHLYANGSILDYPSLDESHLQLMMAMHEVLDGFGLKNVYTDINMHGYKLTNVFSDPDDPDSIATVAFLGTYRQDALDAAVAAADSALEAFGYRDTALTHANTAAAQVVLCQDQVQLAVNQVLLAKGHADDAALSALAANGFSDNAKQSALDAAAAVSGLDARVSALETDVPALELVVGGKLNKDENINLGVSVAASGTAVDFVGIPEGVKRITVMFDRISTTGSSVVLIQIGQAGVIQTAGYTGASTNYASTTGVPLYGNQSGDLRTGFITFVNITGGMWISSGITTSTGTNVVMSIGKKTLSGPLDCIRITTVNGTDQFDDGTINISWEF